MTETGCEGRNSKKHIKKSLYVSQSNNNYSNSDTFFRKFVKTRNDKLIKLSYLSFVISSNLLLRCMLDFLGFPGGSCLQCRRPGFSSWIGKIPWKRAWQPTPVFLPGESHGQRNLAGYSPWGCKELDMTERLSTHTCLTS